MLGSVCLEQRHDQALCRDEDTTRPQREPELGALCATQRPTGAAGGRDGIGVMLLILRTVAFRRALRMPGMAGDNVLNGAGACLLGSAAVERVC